MRTSTALANLSEIPRGEGRAFTQEDKQLAVFHLRDGSVRVLEAVCPHAGGPLADGLVDDNVVVCPLHNYAYDLRTGEETTDSGLSVCAYQASVDEDGSVHVTP
jgi:nitrite reductase (NADH) small subunit